jgi:hypothetical protein
MAVEGMITMSAKERDRPRVIETVREKRLQQGEAGARLGTGATMFSSGYR